MPDQRGPMGLGRVLQYQARPEQRCVSAPAGGCTGRAAGTTRGLPNGLVRAGSCCARAPCTFRQPIRTRAEPAQSPLTAPDRTRKLAGPLASTDGGTGRRGRSTGGWSDLTDLEYPKSGSRFVDRVTPPSGFVSGTPAFGDAACAADGASTTYLRSPRPGVEPSRRRRGGSRLVQPQRPRRLVPGG